MDCNMVSGGKLYWEKQSVSANGGSGTVPCCKI